MTFAGSPDRVEARLVPEAGYELDTFRVSGLPRRPSLAQLRAVLLAAGAPRACRRILRRRRPDVVLGGGGFVAGPMVFAASTMRIPTALTEADAHFGLANRLAAPFARRIFLSYPLETRHRSKVSVVGRPIPERSKAVPQAEARALFELPHEGPVLGVFGALAGAKALNEFVVDTWGASGPPILHITGRRDFDLVRRRVQRERLPRRAGDRPVRRRALGRRPRARALGLERLGDRSGRPPGRSSCRTRSRPATTRR